MLNEYHYISILDAERLIKKEIASATGEDHEEDINWITPFFTTKDVKELACQLIGRSKRRSNCTVTTHLTCPVNDVVQAITKGEYSISQLDPELIKLREEKDWKKISIVIPDERIRGGKEEEYLFKLRKKPLKNALNYLLGFMESYRMNKYDFPKELINREIIALPLYKSSMRDYPGSDEGMYLVAVVHDGKKQRICRVIGNPEFLHPRIAIICEDL
jgi:hypothetical protein